MDDVILRLEGISKSFPGVHALDDVQFELRRGEVHALVGENGAGKSTLMKIIAGVYTKDAGRIIYQGKQVEIPNPRAAQHLGISMIFQELNLMPHLTVAQNIFIGREPRARLRFVLDDKKSTTRPSPFSKVCGSILTRAPKSARLRLPSSRWSKSPKRSRTIRKF